MKLRILICLFAFIVLETRAQEEPPAPDGAIEEAQVIIEKEREIILPFANRYYEKINLQNNLPNPSPLTFDFEERSFDPGNIAVTFTPASYTSVSSESGNQSRLKLGYGNYNSPLVEADIFTKTASNWLLGADLDHLSFGSGVVDNENSAGGRSSLNLIANSMGEQSTFNGRLGYKSRNGYFYGYPEESIINDRDSIKQVINEFQAVLDWKGQLTNDGAVGVKTDFNLANDEYGVSENRFGLGLEIQSPVSDVLSIGLNARANLSQYTNAIADYKRNLFEIDPSATYSNDQLSLKVGAKVALLDEDSSLNEDFIVYPDIRLDYSLSEYVRAYVAISGGIQQHYYVSRSTENFHISDSANLQHASETYRGTLGLSANGQKFSTNVSASYGQIDNLGVFVNRASNPSEFDLIYDQGSTGVFTFNGLFTYNVSNSLIAELDASFYGYSTDSLSKAYHLPTIDASLNLISKINDQWSLAVGGQFMGGITALDTETGNDIDLDAFFDLSVELGYQLSEQWGAFLRADNVLNTDYSRYWRYPNRQIMAKIGATYSF